MPEYRTRAVIVDAHLVSDAWFDDEEFIPPQGVTLNVGSRTAFVGVAEGRAIAKIGQWLVRSKGGLYRIMTTNAFEKGHEASS